MQCEWQDPEMLDAPKPVFRTTELDPHLLATGFEVQTNWHVVTGAPSSGKSTLIDQVAGKGFRTISEIARHYFERELAKGRTIDDIHADPARLQRGIQAMQLAFERGLQPLADVFLDGALPGSMAWYRAFGLDPNEVLAQCFHHRYASESCWSRFPLSLTKRGLKRWPPWWVFSMSGWRGTIPPWGMTL
jgi:hypothetical protein